MMHFADRPTRPTSKNRLRDLRLHSLLLAAGLAGALTGCSSFSGSVAPARVTPVGYSDSAEAAQRASQNVRQQQIVANSNQQSSVAQVNPAVNSAKSSSASQRISDSSSVQSAPQGAVVPVAYQEIVSDTTAPLQLSSPSAPVFASPTTQEPLILGDNLSAPMVEYDQSPYECPSSCGCCSACQDSGQVPCTPPHPGIQNPQEYVYDGGDIEPPATVLKDWSAIGIDPTDTVAYYETEGGALCVTPTNRVPIYAPRFRAVRQVSGAYLATKSVGTQRILAPVKAARVDENSLASTMVQPLSPQGERQVSLIDAFMNRTGGVRLQSSLPPQRMSDALLAHEGVDVAVTSLILEEQPPVTGRVLQNSPTLYIIESLSVEVAGVAAAVARDYKQPQEVFVFEVPDKCALRITKTASHTIADPGDVVRFTLRFDNADIKSVGNIVLSDSLSPRLEYIEGSQQSSVDARFTAVPNSAGSQILRWEIVEPLEKYEGGVITFDCRVR